MLLSQVNTNVLKSPLSSPLGTNTFIIKQIANLQLWIDYSDDSSVVTEGGRISSVADKGPLKLDHTQPNTGNRPFHNTTPINGLATAEYNGFTFMTNTTGAPDIGATDSIVAVVCRIDSYQAFDRIYSIHHGANWYVSLITGSDGIGFKHSEDTNFYYNRIQSNEPMLLVGYRKNGELYVGWDGFYVKVDSGATDVVSAAAASAIGGTHVGSQMVDADIGEVIVVGGDGYSFKPADLKKIENYAATKWNVNTGNRGATLYHGLTGSFRANSAADQTGYFRIWAPAPFKRVRIAPIQHVEASTATGFTAVIGATETAEVNNQNNRYTPRVGNSYFNSLAASPSDPGFHTVQWNGSSSFDFSGPGQIARPLIGFSDWIDIDSVERNDGGDGYLLLCRVHHNGATGDHDLCSGYNDGSETATYKLFQAQLLTGNGVSNLATMPSDGYGTWGMRVAFEFEFTEKVDSVLQTGDSISQADWPNWGRGATYEAVTPKIHMNVAGSSLTSTQFMLWAQDWLDEGVRPTTVINPMWSPNNNADDQAKFDIMMSDMKGMEDWAVQWSSRVLWWTPSPYNIYNESGTNVRENYRYQAEIIGRARIGSTMEVRAGIDTMDDPGRWIAGYSDDGLHPNATGSNVMKAAITI